MEAFDRASKCLRKKFFWKIQRQQYMHKIVKEILTLKKQKLLKLSTID